MTLALLDILWRVCTWCVVGAGGAVFLHALWGDWLAGTRWARRARGGAPRVRCPGGWTRLLGVIPVRSGCWYDMSAAVLDLAGRGVCPECGRASTPRRLRRSRRRYRLALIGVLIGMVGLGGRYAREVYRRGWSAVPDAVLVLVPFDERAWIESGTTGGHWLVDAAAREIADRDRAGTMSRWSAAWLGRRVSARYARDPDHGVDPARREVFARLDAAPFTQGIANQPFAEAARAIATAAGIQMSIDAESLRAGAIDPEARVTIPAFALMTCRQALDWACDRARARSGWSVADWDVTPTGVIVSTDAALASSPRWTVLRAGARSDRRGLAIAARLASPSLGGGPIDRHGFGTALPVRGTARQVCELDTLATIVPLSDDPLPVSSIASLEARLRGTLPVPLDGADSLRSLASRLQNDLRVPVAVDPFGLDLDSTLADVAGSASRAAQDRTSVTADPFGRPGDDAPLPELNSAHDALDFFQADYVSDGDGIAIGLRASLLLGVIRAYRLPEGQPDPRESQRSPGESRSRADDWERRFTQICYSVWFAISDEGYASTARVASVAAIGDLLIVRAPPDVQALARPIIERSIAQWRGDLGGTLRP